MMTQNTASSFTTRKTAMQVLYSVLSVPQVQCCSRVASNCLCFPILLQPNGREMLAGSIHEIVDEFSRMKDFDNESLWWRCPRKIRKAQDLGEWFDSPPKMRSFDIDLTDGDRMHHGEEKYVPPKNEHSTVPHGRRGWKTRYNHFRFTTYIFTKDRMA